MVCISKLSLCFRIYDAHSSPDTLRIFSIFPESKAFETLCSAIAGSDELAGGVTVLCPEN